MMVNLFLKRSVASMLRACYLKMLQTIIHWKDILNLTRFLFWFNKYGHLQRGIINKFILPSDEASSIVYTTNKISLTITFGVCISIIGRGAAINGATSSILLSVRRCFISWHAPGPGWHWSSPWLGGCGHLWEDTGLPQTPVAGWEPQSPMGGLGRWPTLPLDQRKGWVH